mgnify:CR=1 FL=1
MHNVLIIFYIAFSIGNLFILPELARRPVFFMMQPREPERGGDVARRIRIACSVSAN